MTTSAVKLPPDHAGSAIEELSRDQLLDLLEATNEGGIRIGFSGKTNARRLARAVRPRIIRPVEKYCVGTADSRATNFVVEGDNLQAMATLYKERGQVDLILTDPPYNTGKDFGSDPISWTVLMSRITPSSLSSSGYSHRPPRALC